MSISDMMLGWLRMREMGFVAVGMMLAGREVVVVVALMSLQTMLGTLVAR